MKSSLCLSFAVLLSGTGLLLIGSGRPQLLGDEAASPPAVGDKRTAEPKAHASADVKLASNAPQNEGAVLTVPEMPEAVVSIEVARDRARLMHQIYLTTLETLHDHYFHANRAVLPARAMEDIFEATSESSGAEIRWIAVNMKAMSVDHEPADAFEKEAARRIAAGDKSVEQASQDMYRFAGSVPLQESCIQCHSGSLIAPPKKARFAGLAISIPIRTAAK